MCWRKLLSLALLGFLWTSAAFGQSVVNTYDYSRRCVPLGNTVSSAIIDLDATCSASVLDTQNINSLELTPADGSAVSSYQFDIGNNSSPSTDDLTFTGTIGDTGAYYLSDGGDYTELTLASGSMPAFLKNLAKTTGGTDFWIGLTFYHQTAVATKGLAGNNGSTSLPGIFFTINSTEQLVLAQRGDSATVRNTLTLPLLTNDTWYTVLVSYSTGGNVRFWVNSTTAAATQSMTFNTTTTDHNASMRFFKSAGNNAGANMRLRWAGMGNAYLDDTEAANIFAAIEARHATDYTP